METALESRLDLIRDLNLFHPGLIDRFGQWLETAPEQQVFRIAPLQWAREVGAEEDKVIDLFLHATKVGIVEMAWGVLCTQCGMLVTSPGGLRAMSRGKRHCRL